MTKTGLCNGCPRIHEKGMMGQGRKPCDVFFLGSNPTAYDIQLGMPMSSRAGQVVRNALKELSQQGTKYRLVKSYFAYTVRCDGGSPDKEVSSRCNPQVNQEIHAAKPKVIVALGNEALRMLGIHGSIKKLSGKIFRANLNGVMYDVLATQHPYSVYKDPGLYRTFKEDIRRAVDHAYKSDPTKSVDVETLTKDYILPETIEEADALLDLVINYTGKDGGDPDSWLISMDIETNTLKAHAEDAKVIMLSFSWDTGKAGAIYLDHKDAPYDWTPLKAKVQKLLAGPKPKAFHNGKFDIQMLKHVLGYEVRNLRWDTMLAEHLLDEDKKGYYGLKGLTVYYAPDFIGYEEKVKKALNTETESLNIDESEVFEEAVDTAATANAELEALLKQHDIDSIEAVDHIERKVKNERTALTRRRGVLRRKKTRGGLTDELSAELVVLNQKVFKYDAKLSVFKDLRKAHKAATRAAVKAAEAAKTYEDLPVEELTRYAAIDADVTRRIAKSQVGKFDSDLHHIMSTYTIPATYVLGDMEFAGFRVDNGYLENLEERFLALREEFTQKIWERVGREFNINSTAKELPDVLYMERGIPIIAVSDTTGKPKTDKETLAKLAEHDAVSDEDKALLNDLLSYRKCDRALRGFIRGPTGIYELSRIDWHVHTRFNINGTATGRLSSAGKNLQNIPKKLYGINIKAIFVPEDPEEDCVVNVDYSGAELRVLAAYAPDEDLIRVLSNPEEDVHSLFTHRISKATAKSAEEVIPYRDIILTRMTEDAARKKLDEAEFAHRASIMHLAPIYEEQRRQAKRVVFGTLYGMTKVRLAKDLDITEDAAQQIIDGLLKAFPLIGNYIEATKAEVRKQGWVKTKIGRKRRFPLRNMSGQFNGAVREAVNFKIQSTASDIVLGQLIEIAEHAHEIGAVVRITVHDSIVLTMPKRRLPELKGFMDKWAFARVKERYPWLPVPMAYDIEVGPNYGEGDDYYRYMEEHGIEY